MGKIRDITYLFLIIKGQNIIETNGKGQIMLVEIWIKGKVNEGTSTMRGMSFLCRWS